MVSAKRHPQVYRRLFRKPERNTMTEHEKTQFWCHAVLGACFVAMIIFPLVCDVVVDAFMK
jgi:hypothetical protein